MRCAHSVSAASTQGGGGGGGGGDDEGHALTPSSKRAVRTNLCSPRHRLFFSLPPPTPPLDAALSLFLVATGRLEGETRSGEDARLCGARSRSVGGKRDVI